MIAVRKRYVADVARDATKNDSLATVLGYRIYKGPTPSAHPNPSIPSTMPQQHPKILITGAGIAGLSLAQGLKQASIPFHIYERDTSSSFRAQGYRIRLGPDGAGGLKRLLPEHLWRAFEATCAEVVHGGRQIDAQTGETAEWGGPGGPGGPGGGLRGRAVPMGKAYNVDRAVLRDVLLSGLEDRISFGKRLERYEAHGDREIDAYFTDGTTERGTFLVGADGIRSVVRKQLLPNMVILDTEGRAVFGKTNITHEMVRDMAEGIGHGISVIGEGPGSRMKLFTDGMRFDREQSSRFEEQLGLKVPPDYIYWVLVFRKDFVSHEEGKSLLHVSAEQSVKMSLDLTAHWSVKNRAILKHQIPEAASTLAFLTASPNFVSEYSAGKPAHLKSHVTLIGDSLHPMPPVGGVGANSGLQDAADLCDALTLFCNAEEESERERLITACEEKMLERAQEAVARSSGGGAHFFGMKPVGELKVARLWH